MYDQISQAGWEMKKVQYDKKTGQMVATAKNPFGEEIAKTGPDDATALGNLLHAILRRNHLRTPAQWKVGMWNTTWTDKLPEIAEAYSKAPVYDPKAAAAWKLLGDDSLHRMEVMGRHMHIEPTNDPVPYKNHKQMLDDIHKKRHISISKQDLDHPVWTPEQALAFRAVHHVLGHGVAGSGFDWHGRNLAVSAHMPLLDPVAQQALFTEAIARPAYESYYRVNAPTKIAFIKDHIEPAQAEENPAGHRGIHPNVVPIPTKVPEMRLSAVNVRYHNSDVPPAIILHEGLKVSGVGADQFSPEDWDDEYGGQMGGGVYLSDKPDSQYGEYTYVVDVTGLPLDYDPNNSTEVYRGDIPPERISISHLAKVGTTIADPNASWDSGIDPMPYNAFLHHGDPLDYQTAMDNSSKYDTGWSNFKTGEGTPDMERMKQAVVNAFRVALLSPRKDLRWNAIHYQDILHIPAGTTDPGVYHDALENARQTWNVKNYGEEARYSHLPYAPLIPELESVIFQRDPSQGYPAAKQKAHDVLFDWITEEQEKFAQLDKNTQKQLSSNDIERKVNQAVAKRIKLFVKDFQPRLDHIASLYPEDPNYVYHVTPTTERARIQQHGLIPALPQRNIDKWRDTNLDLSSQPEGVYVYNNANAAMFEANPGDDIWRIPRDRIQALHPDPWHHEKGYGANQYYIPHPVRPKGVMMNGFDMHDWIDRNQPNTLPNGTYEEQQLYQQNRDTWGIGKPTFSSQDQLFTPEVVEPLPQVNRYGAWMGAHLKAISQISQHADELTQAALEDVQQHDGSGHHFRAKVLQLGIPGAGPKVASFAWLLLQPMTSQLATIDTHMMEALGHNYDREMNNRDYYKFERELAAGRDASGYAHMPLGAFQHAMWDFKRTGPGTHQDHSAMRVVDPVPHDQVDWTPKPMMPWTSPDWWENTQDARNQVGQEWDDQIAPNWPKNSVPYQHLAKTAYNDPHPFSYWWNKEKPWPISRVNKAAEYAVGTGTSHAEAEKFLDNHKDDVKGNFSDFKEKFFKKFKRIKHQSKTKMQIALEKLGGEDPRLVWDVVPTFAVEEEAHNLASDVTAGFAQTESA